MSVWMVSLAVFLAVLSTASAGYDGHLDYKGFSGHVGFGHKVGGRNILKFLDSSAPYLSII